MQQHILAPAPLLLLIMFLRLPSLICLLSYIVLFTMFQYHGAQPAPYMIVLTLDNLDWPFFVLAFSFGPQPLPPILSPVFNGWDGELAVVGSLRCFGLGTGVRLGTASQSPSATRSRRVFKSILYGQKSIVRKDKIGFLTPQGQAAFVKLAKENAKKTRKSQMQCSSQSKQCPDQAWRANVKRKRMGNQFSREVFV